MEKINIRTGNKADIDKLVELSQLWYEKNKEKKKWMLEQCFNLPNYIIVIAECDNTIIGWLSAHIHKSWVNTEKRLFIDSIFIHPNYRQRGVMRILWKKIEETCDYDIALADTRLDYPIHLGFELGKCKLFIKQKPLIVELGTTSKR